MWDLCLLISADEAICTPKLILLKCYLWVDGGGLALFPLPNTDTAHPPTGWRLCVCVWFLHFCVRWHKCAYVDEIPFAETSMFSSASPFWLLNLWGTSILGLLEVQRLCDLEYKCGPLLDTPFLPHSPHPGCLIGTLGDAYKKRFCMWGNFKGDSMQHDECVWG